MLYSGRACVVLLLVLADVARSDSDSFRCDRMTAHDCSCSEGHTAKDFEIRCPDIDTKVIAKIEMDSYISLDCQDTPNYMTLLPKMPVPLNISALKLEGCVLDEPSRLRQLSAVFGTRNVTKLYIVYGETRGIDRSTFVGLEHLQNLYLQKTELGPLPEDLLHDLTDLIDLDLNGNRVRLQPAFFQRSRRLVKIELGSNQLTEIPRGLFANLTQLRLLNLWENNLTEVSADAFADLSALTSLDLRRNRLEELPGGVFGGLRALERLSLMTNRLRRLPAGLFAANGALRYVQLDHNARLDALPADLFAGLRNLSSVSAEACALAELPEGVLWGATGLRDLNLRRNALARLPRALFRDTAQLETLRLDGNRLQHLPDLVFGALGRLKLLNLADNRLALSDASLYGLDSLERLSLNGNGLAALTSRMMKQVPRVRVLDLSDNRLALPGAQSPFADLTRLEQLRLANNSVDRVFFDWRLNLSNLTLLDLSRNALQYVSYTDLHFTQPAVDVDLSRNRIRTVDMRMAETEARANSASSADGHVVRVDISGNTLACDCTLYDLVRYFDGTMDPAVRAVLELTSDRVQCAPDGGGGGGNGGDLVDVRRLDSRTYTCSLANEGDTRPCPAGAECRFRQHDNMFIVDAARRGLTRAPAIGRHRLDNMEVHLEGNLLTEAPPPGAGYEKARRLFLAHNRIARVDWLPPRLAELQLHGNLLQRLPARALDRLNASSLANLTLHGNPWRCDCDAANLTRFLQINFRKVADLRNVTCAASRRALVAVTESELCPLGARLAVALSAALALLCAAACVLALLYARYRRALVAWLYAHGACPWLFGEDELDADKPFDAFVSYSHHDEQFVVEQLVARLEAGPDPFRLCLHYRDWQPGDYITANIARSVAGSRRTLVVLSRSFLDSEWGKLEFRAAHVSALRDATSRVVVILYGDIADIDRLDADLRAHLQTTTYIKWGQPCFWENLCYALPHRRRRRRWDWWGCCGRGDRAPPAAAGVRPDTPAACTPPADLAARDKLDGGALNVALVHDRLVNLAAHDKV